MPIALSPHWVIVAHSHLRWDFVWQRPQQILSRLARRHRVIFVEEPLWDADADAPRADLSMPLPGVTRLVPVMPTTLQGRYDECTRVVRLWLQRLVASGSPVVQWFFTPMPAPLMLGALDEAAVVYDCMDELSAFRYAPPDLMERERTLLAAADVVFAGGWRLGEAKARWHPNVHVFGCGVDASHFALAARADLPEPPQALDLPRPRLGYIGVIDERLDYVLLRQVASAFPHGALVMIGPRVKVQERELPRAANVHWLGQMSYDALPSWLKAFDVCLMPFARNRATAYINPTKTLEYLAAGKPTVSTAVADVVRQFASVVRIARSRQAFVEQCRLALTEDNSSRRRAGIECAQQHSWEATVDAMARLVAVAARTARPTSIVA